MMHVSMLMLFGGVLFAPGHCLRKGRQRQSTCSSIGCGASYKPSRPCQCNDKCPQYGNCCDDYADTCGGGSGGSPPGNNASYWDGVDTNSKSAMQQRLASTHKKLSYGGLWGFYKTAWVNLPGGCSGKIFDVYSQKCWTPGSGQCGTYKREGDCYNREHSWPKSWWGGSKNEAYSDVFHVIPSDGYVNGKRSAWPFGEVNNPSYTSSEGNKLGNCATSGITGTCFEPTDRVKGLLARAYLYFSVRYAGKISCCSRSGFDHSGTKNLMLKWHADHPVTDLELELNNRAQSAQGNRNPFIDFPEKAQAVFR